MDVEVYPTHPVDTNGAGDMYAGAFLFGITNGLSFKLAGDLASMSASKVVSQFGPRLKKEELLEIRKIVLGA
jgi:sugar/nucleoside kinase (ribokinase family)